MLGQIAYGSTVVLPRKVIHAYIDVRWVFAQNPVHGREWLKKLLPLEFSCKAKADDRVVNLRSHLTLSSAHEIDVGILTTLRNLVQQDEFQKLGQRPQFFVIQRIDLFSRVDKLNQFLFGDFSVRGINQTAHQNPCPRQVAILWRTDDWHFPLEAPDQGSKLKNVVRDQ